MEEPWPAVSDCATTTGTDIFKKALMCHSATCCWARINNWRVHRRPEQGVTRTCRDACLQFAMRRFCTTLLPFKVSAKCWNVEKRQRWAARGHKSCQTNPEFAKQKKVFPPRHISSTQHCGKCHHCSYMSGLTASTATTLNPPPVDPSLRCNHRGSSSCRPLPDNSNKTELS